MAKKARTRTFKMDPKNTCFISWKFTLSEGRQGTVIEDIEVIHSRRPNGRRRGCKGHPKTILALIKGRPVRSIDTELLRDTPCPRPTSCGEALAGCLKKMSK